MKIATWFTGYGSQAMSEVLASFTDDGTRYVVVRVGRGRYDVAEPYAVLRESECHITTN